MESWGEADVETLEGLKIASSGFLYGFAYVITQLNHQEDFRRSRCASFLFSGVFKSDFWWNTARHSASAGREQASVLWLAAANNDLEVRLGRVDWSRCG